MTRRLLDVYGWLALMVVGVALAVLAAGGCTRTVIVEKPVKCDLGPMPPVPKSDKCADERQELCFDRNKSVKLVQVVVYARRAERLCSRSEETKP